MDPIYLIAAVWFGCAILSAIIANVRKTNPVNGFILGLIFGPLGVILTAVQKPPQPVSFD